MITTSIPITNKARGPDLVLIIGIVVGFKVRADLGLGMETGSGSARSWNGISVKVASSRGTGLA
ncbi:hypothetical protein TIFTF001_028049 [Ficus carica]|uniref:Uncharacterized protein n=1 Tax=Ficus carica TaxID=3494 RepID=A0AA88J141_FICCA|nr:hypothetical protein TIFTF001_028049 [Ficus carica]